MIQEEKELLLQDLCSRLPYGVKCDVGDDKPYTLSRIEIDDRNGHLLDFKEKKGGLDMQVYLSECRPYLFPLSSMTEEQRKEFDDLTKVLHDFMKNHAKGNDVTERFFYTQIELWKLKTDWLNKNHFDYRGLISMGLANDATGLNIY